MSLRKRLARLNLQFVLPPALDTLPAWEAYQRLRNLSERWITDTLTAYRRIQRHFGRNMHEMTADDAEAWMRYLKAKNLSASTLTKHQNDWKAYFEWARRVDPPLPLADRDADRRFMPIKGETKIRPYLTAAQAKQLLAVLSTATITDARDAVITALLALTGMRVSELTGLTLDSLRRDAGQIRVTGKGRKQRDIFVPAELWAWVDAWLAYRGTEPGALLLDASGHPMNQDQVRLRLRHVMERAGLGHLHVSPHGLRHSYCKRLGDAGVPPQEAQQQMGHASINTTMHYMHAEVQPETIARLGAILFAPLPPEEACPAGPQETQGGPS